jgi:hypothetical protein
VRAAAIGAGEFDDETRPATGQPLVHREPRRQARARPNRSDASVDENAIDAWTGVAALTEGHLFQPVDRGIDVFHMFGSS